MQKQILMVMMVLLLTPIANFAQENTTKLPLDPKTNLISFTEVIEVGNTTSMSYTNERSHGLLLFIKIQRM
ncbi:MAG: hypothetical protein IPO63_00870 [Bacteroidetes bacterium]|nr:hypothetical protein [Bacteroidota bacterium]